MKKLMLVALGLAALCGAGLQADHAHCQTGAVNTQPCDHQVIPAQSTCVCPKVICHCDVKARPEVVCPTCPAPEKPACAPCARHRVKNCARCR